MNIKRKDGLVGVDIVLALMAIMIFSALIFSIIYSNVLENIRLKKETLAMIYITEIFENIGISDYTDITQDNIEKKIITSDMKKNYTIGVDVTNINKKDGVTYPVDILKKIDVTLTYTVGGKTYSCSMQRMKIKE